MYTFISRFDDGMLLNYECDGVPVKKAMEKDLRSN
jgi:hypothetical protein